jgi:sugar/nucleoside kinase (ribokinase family)
VRVLCAGLATVDLVYSVDRIPGPDEKAQASALAVAAGGPAANAAVTAAALGAEVTLLTAVGAHPLGDLIRADLAACGVTLLDAAPSALEPPPVSAVTVATGAGGGSGQRSIVSRNAGDVVVPAPPHLPPADVVLVDGHHPALAAAAARHAPPGRLVVDAGSWRPVFAEILPYGPVVACSAAFRPPAPLDVPHRARTDGPNPVRWWSDGATGTVAVPPVAAADTSGAGDVFHGALAVAVGAGRPFVAALEYAVAVAGVRVGHAGPRAWLADPRLRDLSIDRR